MVICEKILIHRGSQITTDASWDHLGHPCNQVIMKNVQTQDSNISISHLGQFLKSNPCLMPSDITDFSKMFPFFKFSEWVCSSKLLHLYLEATPLQCTLSGIFGTSEALLMMGFSIWIKSTGTKLKETRKGMGFSGSIELSTILTGSGNFSTTGFSLCQEFAQLWGGRRSP